MFVKHKCFRGEEQKNPEIVRAVAQKLAQFHAMEVPIIKTGNWLFNNYDKSLKSAKERFDLKQLFEETNCQTLMSYDLEREVEWVKRAVLDIQSPYVFNQTDFSCPNILVTESDGIVLIDFEYSCYSFRGHDLGCIFSQWERSSETADQPFQFPDDHIIKPFIESYIEESAKVKGKQYTEDNNNSFEKIVKESKVFGLTAFLSYTFSILLKDKSFSDKKGTMV